MLLQWRSSLLLLMHGGLVVLVVLDLIVEVVLQSLCSGIVVAELMVTVLVVTGLHLGADYGRFGFANCVLVLVVLSY